MKTAKLIIGIISIVTFVLILVSSCGVGISGGISNDDAWAVSGVAGIILAFIVLISGIVGVATRKSRGAGIVTGVFYIAGAILGFATFDAETILVFWAWLSLLSGIGFFISSIFKGTPAK